MATCNFESSQDRDRFIRLTRLLIAGGTPILRAILKQDHTPATLAGTLQGKGVAFTNPQKKLVFPDPPGSLPDFEKFDISLIFKLLRKCCRLTEPATKWNELPEVSDISLEADIARIVFYRNKIYGHALEHMALTQQDFDKYWRIISDTLCRRATHLPGMSVTELQVKINGLKCSPLTVVDLRMFESILAEQGKKLDDIKAAFQDAKLSDIKTPAPSTVHVYNFYQNNMYYYPNCLGECAHPQSFVPPTRRGSEGTIPLPSPPLTKFNSLPSCSPNQAPASEYVGQDGPPDPLVDQAAAPRTWTSTPNQDIYRTTAKDRQASPVSPLVGGYEWPRQQQQKLPQDPLLHIKISVSGADISGFLLREVVQSVLDTSDEGTDASQFTGYLKKHQLVIKKIEGPESNGDYCCIGVSPRDWKSLQDLWHDFIWQNLREVVKETLLPKDFTGEVDVDIDREEYKRCCESLRQSGFKDSGRQLHSQSLSQVGLACTNVTEPAETKYTRSQSAVDLPSTLMDAFQEL